MPSFDFSSKVDLQTLDNALTPLVKKLPTVLILRAAM